MTEVKDTLQVGLANFSAIGFTLASANEILSFVALILSIAYTIYKFIQFDKTKQMARKVVTSAFKSVKKKRKGKHSKNASKGQNVFKKAYRGQGR